MINAIMLIMLLAILGLNIYQLILAKSIQKDFDRVWKIPKRGEELNAKDQDGLC